MKDLMNKISLFTCSMIASVVVLSACAQTTVSVRPAYGNEEQSAAKSATPAQKHYAPISRDQPYVVQAGDTLYGISFRAGLSYREVAAWNDIAEPYTVKIGQRIVLRAPNGDATSAGNGIDTAVVITKPTEIKTPNLKPAELKPSDTAVTPVVISAPQVSTGSAISKPVVTAPVDGAAEKPMPAIESKPVVNSGAMSWRWPSEGTVISRYVQGDTSQQGINIGGKSGQPVKASADGTVVYSGAGLVGYGELIIIKHNNEWLSAYAHNRRRLVAEGAKVNAGDVIAEMGRTGTMRDMLHFEIRRNGKPVDPLLFLPKQ